VGRATCGGCGPKLGAEHEQADRHGRTGPAYPFGVHPERTRADREGRARSEPVPDPIPCLWIGLWRNLTKTVPHAKRCPGVTPWAGDEREFPEPGPDRPSSPPYRNVAPLSPRPGGWPACSYGAPPPPAPLSRGRPASCADAPAKPGQPPVTTFCAGRGGPGFLRGRGPGPVGYLYLSAWPTMSGPRTRPQLCGRARGPPGASRQIGPAAALLLGPSLLRPEPPFLPAGICVPRQSAGGHGGLAEVPFVHGRVRDPAAPAWEAGPGRWYARLVRPSERRPPALVRALTPPFFKPRPDENRLGPDPQRPGPSRKQPPPTGAPLTGGPLAPNAKAEALFRPPACFSFPWPAHPPDRA